jgi:hypothetical protein
MTTVSRKSYMAVGSQQCADNGRILLANLLQRSKRTFSWGSFLNFFAFKEGMLGTPISLLGGSPTVSGRLFNTSELREGE